MYCFCNPDYLDVLQFPYGKLVSFSFPASANCFPLETSAFKIERNPILLSNDDSRLLR